MKNLKFKNGYHVTVDDLEKMQCRFSIDVDSEFYAYDTPVKFQDVEDPQSYFADIDYIPMEIKPSMKIVRIGDVYAELYGENNSISVVVEKDAYQYREKLEFETANKAFEYFLSDIYSGLTSKKANRESFAISEHLPYGYARGGVYSKDMTNLKAPIIVFITNETIFASYLHEDGRIELFGCRKHRKDIRMMLSPQEYDEWVEAMKKGEQVEAIVSVHYDIEGGTAKNKLYPVVETFPNFVSVLIDGKKVDFGNREVYLAKNDNDLVAFIESTRTMMCMQRSEKQIAHFISGFHGIEKGRAVVLAKKIKERLKKMQVL
jgi:hypothetical protein